MIQKVYRWKVDCIPWEKGPIISMTVIVEAKDRKEAELIMMNTKHKFFDQDIHQIWSEPIEGYKRI